MFDDLTVQLSAAPGSASQLSDYITYKILSLLCLGAGDFTPMAVSSVTFNAVSGTMQCVTYTLTDDSILEGTETFTVAITHTGGAALGSPSSAIVTIHDDDGQYIISYHLIALSGVLC